MRAKVMRNFILMLLVSLFTVSGVFSAGAAVIDDNDGGIAKPAYTTISVNSTCISIKGIKATCSATLNSKYSTKLKIKMELQKKKSGVYETIETWSTSGTGMSLFLDKTRNINILCDYRLKTTHTAGSETVVAYDYP